MKNQPLLPATVPTTDRNTHNEARKQDTSHLKVIKLQRHIPPSQPSNQNDGRSDKEDDLSRRLDSHVLCEHHPVPQSHLGSCNVLGRIADEWQDDEAEEDVADVP